MQMVIIAGGLATRLGTLTRDKPKSLLKIGNKSFLEHQLDRFRDTGITDIVLCLGHKGEQIYEYFGDGSKFRVNLKYSFEDKPLGTAGALKNAESLLDNIFFTIYGDSYVFLDYKEVTDFFTDRDKLGLMTVYRNENRYDSSNTTISGELVTEYSKNSQAGNLVYIDYGVNLFRKDVLDMIPEDGFYSLEELFPRLIKDKELLAYRVKERFYEIGSMQGLNEFTDYIARIKEKV